VSRSVVENLENFFRPKETKEPRIEKPVFDKPVFGAVPEQLWRDLIHAFEPTMKPNPHDPYHVILELIKDLHSTNLTRQKEILELRDQNRKLMSDSAGYEESKKLRLEILKWIRNWRDSKPVKKSEWVALINQIYDALDNQ